MFIKSVLGVCVLRFYLFGLRLISHRTGDLFPASDEWKADIMLDDVWDVHSLLSLHMNVEALQCEDAVGTLTDWRMRKCASSPAS